MGGIVWYIGFACGIAFWIVGAGIVLIILGIEKKETNLVYIVFGKLGFAYKLKSVILF
jgi:hypothetical protein